MSEQCRGIHALVTSRSGVISGAEISKLHAGPDGGGGEKQVMLI